MMSKKYLLRSSIGVGQLARLVAKLVDLFIVLLVTIIFYPLGVLVACAYLVVADYMQEGQSIGKRLMGMGVISLEDGSPCSLKQSAIRNSPIWVPWIFFIVPVWGWLFGVVLAVPLLLLEVYLVFKIDSGHRLGDVMADTSVIANDPHRQDIRKKEKTSWFDSEVNPSGTSRSNPS